MEEQDGSENHKQETVTLTKSQLQAILSLLQQIEGICLSDGTSSLSLERNSYHIQAHSGHQSPNEGANYQTKHRTSDARTTSSQSPSSELQIPNYFYQKFNSVQDLSTRNGLQTPIGRNLVHHEAPANCCHVKSPIQDSYEVRKFNVNGNSPDFSRMTPVTSVPCFRRYIHRENQDEWDQKRQKMMEYQAMLDMQRDDIAKRKADETERKRKEDEALEKKLREQREKMRIEFEEEQRRQRDREELMEKKRQDVIQAIEKTSSQIKESKKAGHKGETVSLMSVDAVISSVNKVTDDNIKRTQSMYEVSIEDKRNRDDQREKTFSDASIQTDYSLLLSWLFNMNSEMNERNDLEQFVQQRRPAGDLVADIPAEGEKNEVGAEEMRRIRSRSETRAHVPSPKASPLLIDSASATASSSQTLSGSPITAYPITRGKVCSTKVNVSSKKMDDRGAAGASSQSLSSRPVAQIRNRCKWNLNSGPKPISSKKQTEVKHVQETRRRQQTGTSIPNGSQSSLMTSRNASSADSVKGILTSGEVGTNACSRGDFFTTGSEYHLSLSSTSPDPSIHDRSKTSPVIRKGKKNSLPAIMKAGSGNQQRDQTSILKKSLYSRKRWMSHDDFGSGASFAVDKNDGSCFSRMEDIMPSITFP